MSAKTLHYDCVVIGGGFSGTAFACQLATRTSGAANIALIERGQGPGKGLAFGTSDPAHLLNVPAGKMSLFPDEPNHFLDWLQRFDPGVTASDFVPRRTYGVYLSEVLQATRSRFPALHVITDEAISIHEADAHPIVELHSGSVLAAGVVVVATGYLGSTQPRVLSSAGDAVRQAWQPDALTGIPTRGSVLTLGAGLTAIDQILSLEASGFLGQFIVLSRHGLLPQAHRSTSSPDHSWQHTKVGTARQLLALFRRELNSSDWRSLVNSIRPATQHLWESMPPHEQARFLRHLRTYWDVHRHRCAPQVARTLDRLRQSGRLAVVAGTVEVCCRREPRVDVIYRDRRTQQRRTLTVDRILNCTGFESSLSPCRQPALQSLIAAGHARLGPHRMGLDVDPDGRLLNRAGEPSQRLFTLGPLRKGRLWETTAVPEIREQAAQLSQLIAASVFAGSASAA